MRSEQASCLLLALLAATPAFAENHAAASVSMYQLTLPASTDFLLKLPGSATENLPYATLVREAADKNKLDSALLHAVIATESAYRPDALSGAGAIGLMQLMPDTAKRFGVTNAYSPRQNIQAGAAYLRVLLNRYGQNVDLALAAYNAGEGAVDAYGRKIPPYAETQHYVPTVKARYEKVSKEGSPYRLNPKALQHGAVQQ